ncbi:class I SAM-dependent methyltransferase [Paraburkholderia pallida]|uniref:Class I SAM-dependent methyltransferase n=1 Tax=Paraburkholderia pallida TaxID=2547399 RepID=A0A4P7CR14_9BURK|nr:class I SAM-dependent methyltransferase [Paraburkholderia pallida]QBQ98320.1 class I SAM-dependent methyltransferase [Paraburkholderia pallida]
MDLKEIDVLGPEVGAHWYYASKAQAMRRFLGTPSGTRVLDVGAGSGFFSKHLLAHAGAQEAWCVDISYEAESEACEAGKTIRYLRAVDPVDADLVLLMDVLEHVDDDTGLLREYAAKVPSGGRFLITVPAFQFLWSAHDTFLGHKRRYTLGQLEKTVLSAGLEIEHSAYYFGLVLPIAAALRLAERTRRQDQAPQSQMRAHHPLVNGLLKSLCSIELPIFRFNRLGGLTIFCVARKP